MKIRAGCEISYDCPQPTPTAASTPSLGPYKRMSIPLTMRLCLDGKPDPVALIRSKRGASTWRVVDMHDNTWDQS